MEAEERGGRQTMKSSWEAGCGGANGALTLQGVGKEGTSVGPCGTRYFDWMLSLEARKDQLETLSRRREVCFARGSLERRPAAGTGAERNTSPEHPWDQKVRVLGRDGRLLEAPSGRPEGAGTL